MECGKFNLTCLFFVTLTARVGEYCIDRNTERVFFWEEQAVVVIYFLCKSDHSVHPFSGVQILQELLKCGSPIQFLLDSYKYTLPLMVTGMVMKSEFNLCYLSLTEANNKEKMEIES